ncbi:MAG: hypothetical protein Q7T33_13335 [Dehalococcoidia bacterium]|nr:hypothetical protein [Dehalococcoidia bacterium]
MGRVLMYLAIGGLALFVGTATFLTEHGGGSTAAVAQVTVHNLRMSPQSYVGKVVTTEGRLSFTEEHGLFQVVSEDLAVVIRTYDGAEDLPQLSGLDVRVTGRFGFDSELGIYLDADSVTALALP